MKDVHPAITLNNPNVDQGQTTEEIIKKTFGDLTSMTVAAITGLQRVYQIEWQPVIMREDETRLSHVALIYPRHCWDIVLKKPMDKVATRLEAKGIIVQGKEVEGVAFITVFWPLKEFRKIVRTWHDLDAPGATCMLMDRELGFICGTVAPF